MARSRGLGDVYKRQIQTFIQNEHMRFGIKSVFFVGFNNVVLHHFGFKRLVFLLFPA
jgi:hypothetical protein